MNLKLLIPGLLILAGLWIWQASELSKLGEEERTLRSTVRRLPVLPPSLPAPVPAPVPALVPVPATEPVPLPPPPPVSPGPAEVARSLMDEFAALLGDGSTATKNAKHRDLALLKEKLATQPPEVLRHALRILEEAKFPAHKEHEMLASVLYALDDTDAETCLRFVTTGKIRKEFVESISTWMRRWASVNPAGARQWLEEAKAGGALQAFPTHDLAILHEGTIAEIMHAQLLCGEATADLAGFDFRQLDGLDSSSVFRFGADLVMPPMTPEQRALYLKRVWAEVSNGKTAEKLLTLATSRWSDRVPGAELKQLVDSLAGSPGSLPPERQALLTKLRTEVAAKSGDAPSAEGLEWALQGVAEPEQRKNVITGVVAGWAASSFDKTGTFLNALPKGPERDAAVIKFAQVLGSYDSQAQLQWAALISDTALRKKTLATFKKEIEDDARRFPKKPD